MAANIKDIVDRYNGDAGQLVSILQDVQAEYRYLPKEALQEVSCVMSIPVSQVYSVATFFKAFSLQPRGRHTIKVCLGTACHVRGGARVAEKMELDLGIKRGETTDDLRFTLETVNCVGCCALGPMVLVDDEYHGQMTSDKVSPLLAKYE
ncbi:MAG: NADH-quinone oxidoreductase subunit NuoE [Chloroflexi bacterium]|nr:MAG: NADH-quinone oxidoreductase subunit NuoE [Chloroflexota bacterium]RLC96121.1 MAG: NADH-quinone oxidoreductase subunit NuoE [Chloroflexota bacterium]